MNETTIAVGTKSEQKIKYVEETIEEIGLHARIMPIECESKISKQSITEEETKQGSINRAKNAIKKSMHHHTLKGVV